MTEQPKQPPQLQMRSHTVISYWQRVRAVEASIKTDCAVVISLQTDGGRAGVPVEAPKHMAAQMIVRGEAYAASAVEALDYRQARKRAHQLEETRQAQARHLADISHRLTRGEVV